MHMLLGGWALWNRLLLQATRFPSYDESTPIAMAHCNGFIYQLSALMFIFSIHVAEQVEYCCIGAARSAVIVALSVDSRSDKLVLLLNTQHHQQQLHVISTLYHSK